MLVVALLVVFGCFAICVDVAVVFVIVVNAAVDVAVRVACVVVIATDGVTVTVCTNVVSYVVMITVVCCYDNRGVVGVDVGCTVVVYDVVWLYGWCCLLLVFYRLWYCRLLCVIHVFVFFC